MILDGRAGSLANSQMLIRPRARNSELDGVLQSRMIIDKQNMQTVPCALLQLQKMQSQNVTCLRCRRQLQRTSVPRSGKADAIPWLLLSPRLQGHVREADYTSAFGEERFKVVIHL